MRGQIRGPLGTGLGVLYWEQGLPPLLCQPGAWLSGEAALSLGGYGGGVPSPYLPLSSRVKADGHSLGRSEAPLGSRGSGWPAWQEGGHQQGCLPASPLLRKHGSFIQSLCLRRQELCSPQPAATFAHVAWVLQSDSSRPTAPSKCQPCSAGDECVAPGHTGAPAGGPGPPSFQQPGQRVVGLEEGARTALGQRLPPGSGSPR